MLDRTRECVPLRVNELCRPSSCCGSVCVVRQTDGFTPLCVASQNGHVEVVRALVGAGAAVNQADVRDDWGGCWCSRVRDDVVACAFSSFCMCGVRGVVQADGATPMYIASVYGNVEVVRALVGAGAAVNQAKVCESWLAFGVRVHVGGG
jgi:ankyrin repeat protein